MNIWKHSRLSVVSFGGVPEDYQEIHQFLDTSKLFYFHVKHRVLLHNTFGIDLCTQVFGQTLQNSDGQTVVVRDVAAQHCQEDLSGRVPTLHDWFQSCGEFGDLLKVIPEIDDTELHAFVHAPYLHSGIKASYLITCSDFGVDLAKRLLGSQKALLLRELVPENQNVKALLQQLPFTQPWQYTPKMDELKKIE